MGDSMTKHTPSVEAVEHAAKILPLAIAALPDRVTLAHIDYRDELSTQQIVDAFEGKPPCENTDFDEWESDARRHGLNYYIEDVQKDLDLEDWEIDLIRDDLVEALYDRDDTDLWSGAMRNTPGKWMRYWIDERDLDSDELLDRLINPGVPGVASVLDALGLLGTDQHTPELEAEIEEAIANSGVEAAIYLLWYGDIDELVEAAARDYEGAPPQTITWKDPMLLLYHPFYGNGWADTIHATITTTFDRDKLHLDERGGGGGYSFSDEVCGGLVGNDDTTVTITRKEFP